MSGLVVVAAIVLVAWFAAGTIWNVRLGNEAMRWMQGGLPLLGERAAVRWLGSSVAELTINEGKAELARATVVVFLEPRDLPWWPISRLRGRRDTLIVRAAFRRSPSLELEALDPASWSGRDALGRIPEDWPVVEAGGLTVFGDKARADALVGLARRSGLVLRRLSVRRSEPHFQLHVALPERTKPAREFFEAVHALSQLALRQ